MLKGICINPIIPVGSVALCIVLFYIITEHDSSEFLDKVSTKEKYLFNFDS